MRHAIIRQGQTSWRIDPQLQLIYATVNEAVTVRNGGAALVVA
jgi:hypothetical protein